MGNVDRVGNRTFKVNFTSYGVEKLRETVKQKLKEFMEDYTDDTLVEYVIVLLRNGRRKEEARNELNVFLGDDSDSFISWLWDHLASCLDLYVLNQGLHDEAPKSKNVSSEQGVSNADKLGAESERENAIQLSRRRHDKEWKDLVGEGNDAPPLRSSVVYDFPLEDKARKGIDNRERSSSPIRPVQRKRNRSDDWKNAKKDLIPQVTIDAPRRLLQFAVRGAVATSRTSNPAAPAEPSLKRLCSVVSSAGGDSSSVDHPQRIQSVASRINPLATVIKAVAEASEDVRSVKYSGSVFDRLGRAIDPLETNVRLEDDILNQEQLQPKHFQSGYSDMATMENKGLFACDFPLHDDGYDNINRFNQDMTFASKDEDFPSQRIQSVASRINPFATVIKAVAEAAEDVRSVKYSGSVFDRLGRAIDPLETNVRLEDDILNQEQLQPKHFQSGYSDMATMENKGLFACDFPSHDDGYDNINRFNQDMTFASKDEDLLLVQYDVKKVNKDVMLLKQRGNVNQQAIAPKTSLRVEHFAANKGPRKKPYFQKSREITRTVVHKSLVDSKSGHLSSSFQPMKENGNTVKIIDGSPKHAADTHVELRRTHPCNAGLFPSGQSLEDADSRTIFVSNVHFAATKDSLSRHFNKFGEILKVIILTDAATGQPKGAAYVEFMQKEAADNALSLDGTSFMSRIIKVVKRGTAPQESSQTITWPPRASPFDTSRFGKFPFARGVPGAYRPWPPIKHGAQSMQWKRNVQNVSADGAAASGSINSTAATWSRTYVRTEVKHTGSSGST